MALYTKCIYEPMEPSDGHRISVIGMHNIRDPKTGEWTLPDPNITPDSYNEWLPKLSAAKVVGAYYRGEITWDQYEPGYLEYLRTDRIKDLVQSLARQSLEKDITVMCVEKTPEQCHRRLLAEECKRVQLGLEIIVR